MSRTKTSKRTLPPIPQHRSASVFDDPPRKNVFLLGCMDQRLLDDTVQFMNSLNLHNRYDQLSLAGSSMGAHRLFTSASDDWQSVFFVHLRAAINVLQRPIQDIFLLEHLDCGAYRYLHPNDSVKKTYASTNLKGMEVLHGDELREFAWEVYAFIEHERVHVVAEYETARQSCGKDTDCWVRLEKAAKKKVEAWTDIRISCLIMNVRGVVEQLER